MLEFARKSKQANKIFRELQGQVECSLNDIQKLPSKGFDKLSIQKRGTLKTASSLYDKYKSKSPHKYNSRDILFYYIDLAKSKNIKFVSNTKSNTIYMANIKLALKNYTIDEVLGMYDFLFNSGQTYIDMKRTNPGIIVTSWVNTIFSDYELYKKGKFVDKTFKKFENREYSGDTTISSVGSWED